jgi:hypothetical protein
MVILDVLRYTISSPWCSARYWRTSGALGLAFRLGFLSSVLGTGVLVSNLPLILSYSRVRTRTNRV